MDNKILLFAVAIIIALTGLLISMQVFHTTSNIPPKISFPKNSDLTNRKVIVLTNRPHAKAAHAMSQWFYEETGAVVQNIVVDYRKTLSYIFSDFFSDSPTLDVLMLWYVDIGTLAEKGILKDLTDFIEKNKNIIKPHDFISSIYDSYTLYNGRRWALPYDGDIHVLFYRKSLLQKYNLMAPETWDDYLNIARIITENEKEHGIYGTAVMAPPISIIIISSFMNRLISYGGRFIDENGKPVINSKEALDALYAMIEHSKYALPTSMETDWEVSRDAFLSGSVAMVEQWTDIGIMAEDPEQSIIQGDWGVIQMPRGAGNKAVNSSALNAGFCLGISTKTLDLEAAQQYLLFATRPDISLRINLINGGVDPTRISVLNSSEYQHFAPQLSKVAKATLKKTSPWPVIPQLHNLNEILMKNIIFALEGHKSPKQALDDTQNQWMEILGLL